MHSQLPIEKSTKSNCEIPRTSVIGNTDTTFQAVGAHQASLAQALHQLPVALGIGWLGPGHRGAMGDRVAECDVPGAEHLNLPVQVVAALPGGVADRYWLSAMAATRGWPIEIVVCCRDAGRQSQF